MLTVGPQAPIRGGDAEVKGVADFEGDEVENHFLRTLDTYIVDL